MKKIIVCLALMLSFDVLAEDTMGNGPRERLGDTRQETDERQKCECKEKVGLGLG